MATTIQEVKSAAELERLRLAQQASQARGQAEAQAQQAEAQTEEQARHAISETEQQAQVSKSEAQQEAESRQAEIRKQRGQAEREAEAAKTRAREAQRLEQRKVVLPISKPRDLGLTSYIANVETTRKQAHQAGESAKVAVTKVRDDYFKEVDKARDEAIADINKQKAGIISDIQKQLVNINADITKQLANANSGVTEWENESNTKIAKAQADYEAAVKAALNRSGTDVFTDMKSKGLIPVDAVYNSYDKATGQVSYSLPPPKTQRDAITTLQNGGFVTNSGGGNYSITVRNEAGNLANITTIKAAFPDLDTSQISDLQAEHDAYIQMQNEPQTYFKRLQTEGKVPAYAVYKSIDTKTGEVQYEIPAWSTIDIDKIRPTNTERVLLTEQYTGLASDSQAFVAQAALGRSNFIVHDTKDGFELLGVRGQPSLSADDKDRVLAYYKEQILASDNPTQTINDLYTNIVKAQRAQLKSAAPTLALLVATAAVPMIIPVVPAVVGMALNLGLSAAFIGLGTYGLAHTVKNVIPNPAIPTWQKVLSIGLDTAAIAAGIYGLKGIRGIKAAPIKAGEAKITIGKQKYIIPNDLAESVAKTAATKGGLTAVEEANCARAIRTIQEGIIAKDTEIVVRGANMLDKAQGGKVIFGETAHIRANPAAYIDDAYNAAKAISPTELTANTRFVKANALNAMSESHQTIKLAANELARATSTTRAIRAQSAVSMAISTMADVASKEYNTLNRLGRLPKTRLPISPQTNLLEKPRVLTPLEYSVYSSTKTVPKLKGWSATTKADSAVILAREIPGHVRLQGLADAVNMYGKTAVKAVYPKLTTSAINSAKYLNSLTNSYYRTARQAILSDVQNRVITNLTGQPPAKGGTNLPPFETVASEKLVGWVSGGPVPHEVVSEVANARPVIQVAEGGAFKYTPTVDTQSKIGLKYPLYIDDNTVNAAILRTLGGKFTVYGEGGATSSSLTQQQLDSLKDMASYDVVAPIPETEGLTKLKAPKPSPLVAKELQLTKPVDVPLIMNEFPEKQIAKVLKGGKITETSSGLYSYESKIQRFDEKMVTGERIGGGVSEHMPELRMILKSDNLGDQSAEVAQTIVDSVKHNGFVKTINQYGRALTTAVYPYAIAHAAVEDEGNFQISFVTGAETTKPTKPFEPTGPIKGGTRVATKESTLMVQSAIKTLVVAGPETIGEWVKPDATSTPETIKATEVAAAAVAKEARIANPDVIRITEAGLRAGLKAGISNETSEGIKSATQNAIENSVIQSTWLQTQTQIQKQTLTTTATKVATEIAMQVTDQTRIEKETGGGKTTVIPPPDESKSKQERQEYPDGTIAWRMGETKGDVYKIIPPPYTMLKPISSRYPPKGMTKTKGTPQETLTFIGGKLPFKNVSFDLGVTDGFIDVKDRTIKFTGGGERTNVGTRLPETTRGMALTDNPPLLSQLLRPPRARRQRQSGGHTARLQLVTMAARPRGRPASHGVYADQSRTRISRRPRRHWKRIY